MQHGQLSLYIFLKHKNDCYLHNHLVLLFSFLDANNGDTRPSCPWRFSICFTRKDVLLLHFLTASTGLWFGCAFHMECKALLHTNYLALYAYYFILYGCMVQNIAPNIQNKIIRVNPHEYKCILKQKILRQVAAGAFTALHRLSHRDNQS